MEWVLDPVLMVERMGIVATGGGVHTVTAMANKKVVVAVIV